MKRTTTRTLALIAGAMIPMTLTGAATASAGAVDHHETAAAEPKIDAKAKKVWDRYVEKTLGDAAQNRDMVESVVTEGRMEMKAQGMTMRMRMVILPGEGTRMTMTIPQMGQFDQGSYKGTVWSNNMMQGPRILEGAEAAQFSEEGDIFADLEWDKYYDEISYEGEETISHEDGTEVETHVLTLDPKRSDSEETQYFSKETGLLVKTVTMIAMPGQGEAPSENFISDYREREGLMFPFRIVSKLGPQEQVITFTDVEVNAEVDESEIEPPQEIKDMMDG